MKTACEWREKFNKDGLSTDPLCAEIEAFVRKIQADAIEAAAQEADAHRDLCKRNEAYPAYGLNSQAMAAGNIADAIRALAPTGGTK